MAESRSLLVTEAVILTSLYQEQSLDGLVSFLDEVQVRFRPSEIGITFEEIERALLALPSYLQEEAQLAYGVYHHKGVNPNQVAALIERLVQLGVE